MNNTIILESIYRAMCVWKCAGNILGPVYSLSIKKTSAASPSNKTKTLRLICPLE